jgi:c-di-GMP-binding flagellar brake protein YcgR
MYTDMIRPSPASTQIIQRRKYVEVAATRYDDTQKKEKEKEK